MLVHMFLPANSMKSTDYVKPEISDYGDLADLTAGLSSGSKTDAIFPTPRRDWSFSTP
jgi:hypothetical protein